MTDRQLGVLIAALFVGALAESLTSSSRAGLATVLGLLIGWHLRDLECRSETPTAGVVDRSGPEVRSSAGPDPVDSGPRSDR